VDTCSITPEPQVIIGVTEGPEPYQLYRVFDATRLSNGDLAVVNEGSNEIRVFDSTGVFLRAFGGEGEGPGEFRNAFQIWTLPGDTLWVGDYRPWRFLIFTSEGEWVRTVQPSPMYVNSPREMGLLHSGHAVLGSQESTRSGSGFHPAWLHVVIHDGEGVLIDSLGVFPHGRFGQTVDDPNSVWLYPYFEPFTRVAVTADRFAISTAEYPEIMVHDPQGKLIRIVRWAPGDRTVRDSDVEAEKRRLLDQYPDMETADRRRFVEPLIHPDRPVSDLFPSLEGLRYGTDGTLWVRGYPRPDGLDTGRWTAFDSEGRLRCRAEIPNELSVYELGADYLLGKMEDQVGVERVVLFGLRWARQR
jgi:hypothetical protein